MPTNEQLGNTYNTQLQAGDRVILIVNEDEKINYTVPIAKKSNCNMNCNETDA